MALLLACLPVLATEAPREPVIAPDDTLLFVRDGDIFAARAGGPTVRNLTNSVDRESRPAGSPDGTAIAYEVYDVERADYDIWLCSAEGTGHTKLLPRGRNPAWSPDGGRLALAAQQRAQGLNIFVCNRRGGDLTQITNNAESDYLPCWSPDGTRLAYVREEVGAGRREFVIVVRSGDGSEQDLVRLADRRIGTLTWSPQRDLLVGAREPGGDLERLYRVNPDGERRLDEVTSGPDEEIFGLWAFAPEALVCVERRGNRLQLATRRLGEPSEQPPGSQDGDTEPSLLPGPSRRAPHLYVFGRRSFYLPTPIALDEDVLVPAPDLATQLNFKLETEPNRLTLRREGRTIILDLLTNEVISGESRSLLGIKCEQVAGVPMLPLRKLAEILGFSGEWHPETRILRVS